MKRLLQCFGGLIQVSVRGPLFCKTKWISNSEIVSSETNLQFYKEKLWISEIINLKVLWDQTQILTLSTCKSHFLQYKLAIKKQPKPQQF